MRRIVLPAPVRFILVIAIAFVLSTLIDPYLWLGSPFLAQAVDAVLPVIAMLLVWALSGRAWVALLIEILLLGILDYANYMKMLYLDTDIVYADFTILLGLLKDPRLVLGFLHPSAVKIAIVVAVLVAIALIGWFTRHRLKASWKYRLACGLLAVTALVGIGLARAPDQIDFLQWQVYAQAVGARHAGIAGNILLGRMTARDVNRPPDPKAERAFWHEPAVLAAERGLDMHGNGQRPDIVIVQSESLFESSQLCGFPDAPVLKHVAQEQPSLPGNLHVPVFGGRTLQTEFEVLSGSPISYYPGSMFAYYELVNHHFDALPHVLDRYGYKTIAIHPNDRGFWHRGTAFPDMGFDTFQDINSFVYPRDYSERGHVSDEAFTRAILAELDSSNRPTFVMAISINNHGPWGEFAPNNDADLGLPTKLHGKARAELADYVEHAIDADNAYGFLLDALKRRGRPAVVVFYGDHMPALPRVYEKLCFKDGKPPEDHYPPYRIWANFPMPKPPAETSAYLLQGWLLHVAGLPLEGHMLANLLAGVVANDSSLSPEVRQRVLGEYANIAAANVDAEVTPVRNARTVFIGQDKALSLLMKHESGNGIGVSVSDGALQFAPVAGKPARVAFGIHGAVAALSLRPYLDESDTRCRFAPASRAAAEISMEGDGRELYRAWISPKTLRLAALDLRGIKRLIIQVGNLEAGGASKGCDRVTVQVAQMLCYSAACSQPGSSPPPGSPAALPSRILSKDPIAGDIAHLASMTPLARRAIAGKHSNLDWMVRHETGHQYGTIPFVMQPDGRLLMPPAGDHSAWIDFNVAGLDTIELSPRINQLSQKCLDLDKPDTRVGVVRLDLSLDGKPLLPGFIVDRHYHELLKLNVKGGSTLRIDVHKGSSVNWCDWFSVGFPKLKGQALSAKQDENIGPPAAGAITAHAPARGATTAKSTH